MKYNALVKKCSAALLSAVMVVTALPMGMGGDAQVWAAETYKTNRHVSVHDPSIVRDKDGTYYVFGSHETSAKSTDLKDWKTMATGYNKTKDYYFGDVHTQLADAFKWAGWDDSDCKGRMAIWAPDVKWNADYEWEDGTKGAYMMYLCTSSTYCRSAIGYAVSKRIDKDYQYVRTLVCSGFTKTEQKDNKSEINKLWSTDNTNIKALMDAGRIDPGANAEWFFNNGDYNTDYAPNAIDPTIFWDKDGRMWMTYGSWSGGIFLLELDPKTGDAIYPKSNGKTEDGRYIDKYFGIHLAGGFFKSGEGPYILYDKDNGYYYLYTTYDGLATDGGYNMRLFRATNPEGPYLDAAGNSAVFNSKNVNQYETGTKVMGNYNLCGICGYSSNRAGSGYKSPGHCSSFIDEDGQRYLVYHTRFRDAGENHQVRVHQQFLNEDKWPVTAVYENRGDEISAEGYKTEDIVGEYQFLNHGTSSDGANVRQPSTVILKSDGSITGEETGTWKQGEGNYYATIEVGGVTYKGVFFKQTNELGQDADMTFTAIGSNNETIWGARVSADENVVIKSSPDGKPALDFAKLSTQPSAKYTFDSADEKVTLVGDKMEIKDGSLYFGGKGNTVQANYAELSPINDIDFTKGFTFAADIAVQRHVSEWTAILSVADRKIGSKVSSAYPVYHLTQGFSSVIDYKGGKVGYLGSAIKAPYSADYFSKEENRCKWMNVAVTITAKQMNTYINGECVESLTSGKSFAEDNKTLKDDPANDFTSIMDAFFDGRRVYLGGSLFNADPDFAGWMDNAAIYNAALTPEAVKAIATGTDMAAGAAECVTGEDYKPADPNENNQGENNQGTTTDNNGSTTPKQDTEKTTTTALAKGAMTKDSAGNAYKVTNASTTAGTVTYTGAASKNITSAKVPDKLTLGGVTYKVTKIADGAFKNCKKLKTASVGANVSSIGSNAFAGCGKLKKVTIGSGVTTLGKKAFYKDSSLKTIVIKSKKLKKVGANALKGINKSAKIKVPKAVLKKYKKYFKNKGQKASVKITK